MTSSRCARLFPIAHPVKGIREAIYCHAEGDLIDGEQLAEPSTGEELDLDGGVFAYVDVDMHKLSTETEQVNVTLPKLLIAMIDAASANRSRFLSESAMKALEAKR